MSKKRKHAHPYVGMPAFLKLELFSQQVQYAFDGVVPYLCGSSVKGKKWRDVDVRLILDDKPFRKRFGKRPFAAALNATNLAWSALGREMTGLPIDFQIQKQSHFESLYVDEPRIGLIEFSVAHAEWVEGDF